MSEIKKIALDAMGGDYAPAAPVCGAVRAVEKYDDIKVILVGRKAEINAELSKYNYPKDAIEVINATEVIITGEPPVKSIREKKDSSLVVALKQAKEKCADAVISAGNTGSILVGGQTIVRREKGVERSPIATVIPTEKGAAILVDSGANVDARADHLVQFAIMGQAYAERVMNIKNPKVGLLNIGSEEEKGNAVTKEVYALLKERDDINFIGNVEGNEVSKGKAEVIVADGFAGNLMLKTYEGVASTLIKTIKDVFMTNTKTKLGAMLIKSELKETLKTFDADQYGGAPLLGLKALVVKAHGNSKADSFKTAIGQWMDFMEADLITLIRDSINKNTD